MGRERLESFENLENDIQKFKKARHRKNSEVNVEIRNSPEKTNTETSSNQFSSQNTEFPKITDSTQNNEGFGSQCYTPKLAQNRIQSSQNHENHEIPKNDHPQKNNSQNNSKNSSKNNSKNNLKNNLKNNSKN